MPSFGPGEVKPGPGAGGILQQAAKYFAGETIRWSPRPGSLRTTGMLTRSSGCGLVEVRRSSYYAWRAGAPARQRRQGADAALTERVRLLHKADPAMGSPRTDRRAQRHYPGDRRAGEP